MLLTPRYGSEPVVAVEVREPGDHPMVHQRTRLGQVLAELSKEEWAAPSRCEHWSAQDVVTHLTSTNRFWALSIEAGLAGAPTTFLATFDPASSPLETTRQAQGTPPEQTLEDYLDTAAALAEVVARLDDEAWDTLAEAPPGHLPISLVGDHALWDAWVHERDILLPLGRDCVADRTEVVTTLRYCAALGPAFALGAGLDPPGPIDLRAVDLDVRVVVEIEDACVRVHDGPAPPETPGVELDALTMLEHLSRRDPRSAPPAALRALTGPIGRAFDQPI